MKLWDVDLDYRADLKRDRLSEEDCYQTMAEIKADWNDQLAWTSILGNMVDAVITEVAFGITHGWLDEDMNPIQGVGHKSPDPYYTPGSCAETAHYMRSRFFDSLCDLLSSHSGVRFSGAFFRGRMKQVARRKRRLLDVRRATWRRRKEAMQSSTTEAVS